MVWVSALDFLQQVIPWSGSFTFAPISIRILTIRPARQLPPFLHSVKLGASGALPRSFVHMQKVCGLLSPSLLTSFTTRVQFKPCFCIAISTEIIGTAPNVFLNLAASWVIQRLTYR